MENSDLKGLAQSLINNDRSCKEMNGQLKNLKIEQKGIKSRLQDMMTDRSIDVLTKSGSKIELKKVERKDPMSKTFVEKTLSSYLDQEILQEAMKQLYDDRPRSSNQLVRLHTPRRKDLNTDDARTEMSDISDLQELHNQFNVK